MDPVEIYMNDHQRLRYFIWKNTGLDIDSPDVVVEPGFLEKCAAMKKKIDQELAEAFFKFFAA